MTVSIEQLDIEETVTVYLFFPSAQLPTRPKTPTFIPGDAVTVLRAGVATTAQPVLPEGPPPPPLPFCAGIGIAAKARHANTKRLLTKEFLIVLFSMFELLRAFLPTLNRTYRSRIRRLSSEDRPNQIKVFGVIEFWRE